MIAIKIAPTPPAPARPASPPDTTAGDDQRRWAEWLAKGYRHDASTSRRIRVVAALVVAGLVTWAVWTLR